MNRSGGSKPERGGRGGSGRGRSRQRPRSGKKEDQGAGSGDACMEVDGTDIANGANTRFVPRPFKRPSQSVLAHRDSPFITHFVETADPWDQQNQQKMQAMALQMRGDLQLLYESFQAMREAERTEMQNRGLVDKQDARKNLRDALVFVGTCRDMCPTFERIRRTYENNIMNLEKDSSGNVVAERAVKAFSRPAAGQPPPLPSDVRPPSVLVTTLRYLVENIVPKLPTSHPFLWDRTRSIRQDFTYQNYGGPEAVYCNEVIARIHLVCMHVMAGSGMDYSRQQELEQFNKSLQTLSEFYSANPKRTLSEFPCEPEMRAYQLLSHLSDPELAYAFEKLPAHVKHHPLVILAGDLRSMVYRLLPRGRFGPFFNRLKQPDVPVLFQCLAEVHFVDIRLAALKAINKSLNKRSGSYPLRRLTTLLGFDEEDEARAFCAHYGLECSYGPDDSALDFQSWNECEASSKTKPSQPCSKFISSRLDYAVLLVGPQPLPHQEIPTAKAPFKFRNTSRAGPSSLVSSSGQYAPAPDVSSRAVDQESRAPAALGSNFGPTFGQHTLAVPANPTVPATSSNIKLPTPQATVTPAAVSSPYSDTPGPQPRAAAPKEHTPQKPLGPLKPSNNDMRAYLAQMIASSLKPQISGIVTFWINECREIRQRRNAARQAFIQESSVHVYERLLRTTIQPYISADLTALLFNRSRLRRALIAMVRKCAVHAVAVVNQKQRMTQEVHNEAQSLMSVFPRRISNRSQSWKNEGPVMNGKPAPPRDILSDLSSHFVTEIAKAIAAAAESGMQNLAIHLRNWDSDTGKLLINLFGLVYLDGVYSITLQTAKQQFFTISSEHTFADLIITFDDDGSWNVPSLSLPSHLIPEDLLVKLSEFLQRASQQSVRSQTKKDICLFAPRKRRLVDNTQVSTKHFRSLQRFVHEDPTAPTKVREPAAPDPLEELKRAISDSRQLL